MQTLALANDFILGAGTEILANTVRDFIGPILMIVVGVIALTFLVRREMTQFIMFLIITIAVFAIFYAPGILKSLAKGVADGADAGTWTE